MPFRGTALAGALLAAALWPAGAGATPVSGPHETVDITATTTRPNTSTGLNYVATYHAAGNSAADPPALRRLVLVGPRGIRYDTKAAPECDATDKQLKEKGDAACPSGSKIGSGSATVRILGAAPATFDITAFNAPNARFELVEFPVGAAAVIRDRFHGRRDIARIPTCLQGGQPPDGCQSDEIVLLANEVHQDPRSSGSGRHRRELLTTPPHCPPSGHWKTRVILSFADGSVDRLTTYQPCQDDRSQSAWHDARHRDGTNSPRPRTH